MATIRERIVVAALAALNGVGKPADLTWHRFRTRPLEAETQLPAGLLYPTAAPGQGQSETVERLDHDDGVERRLNLRAELRVPGSQPDTALDPYYLWTVEALRTDPTLGGLAKDLQEVRSDFAAVDAAEGPVGLCGIDFEVTYFTEEDDPEAGL